MFDKSSCLCEKYCQGNTKPNEMHKVRLKLIQRSVSFFFCVDKYITIYRHVCSSMSGHELRYCASVRSDIIKLLK